MNRSQSHSGVSLPAYWRQVSFICFDLGVMNVIGGAGATFFHSLPLYALGFTYGSFLLGGYLILLGLGSYKLKSLPSVVPIGIIVADVAHTIYFLPKYELAGGVVLVKISFLLPLVLTLISMIRVKLKLSSPSIDTHRTTIEPRKEKFALLSSMIVSVGTGIMALLLFAKYAMPAITQSTNPLVNIFHDLLLVPALLLLFPLGAAAGELIWLRASGLYLSGYELSLFIRYLRQIPLISRIADKILDQASKEPEIESPDLYVPINQGSSHKYLVAASVILFALISGLVLVRGFIIPKVLSGAVTNPPPASAAPGTFVVSQSGNGQYSSIEAAVAAVPPGSTILVQTGVYREQVILDKDITLLGDQKQAGPVTIECAQDGCLRITAEKATVRNVAIRVEVGFLSRLLWFKYQPAAVYVLNGRSTIEECDISSNRGPGIIVRGANSAAEIRNSRVHDCRMDAVVFTNQSQGLVLNSHVYKNQSSGIVVTRDSTATIEGTTVYENASGLVVANGGKPIVRKSVFRSHLYPAIDVRDGEALIEQSQIYGGQTSGIYFREGSAGRVHECSVFGNAMSNVVITTGRNPQISKSNLSESGYAGVLVQDGGEGSVIDCQIFNNYLGIDIRSNSTLAVQNSAIKNNKHQGLVIDSTSAGSITDSRLIGNADGAWKVEAGAQIMRERNTE